MATQYAFHIDSSSCVNCKTCQIACQDYHNLSVHSLWRKVFQYGGGVWEGKEAVPVPRDVFVYSVSIACNHCMNPACMESCPSGAITKDEDTGIVRVDSEVCIGCRTCEQACPYYAPQFDEESGPMGKCDMCIDLVKEGKNPVCVDACPMRALDVGPIDELREAFGSVNELEPLPKASETAPSLVITPHAAAQSVGEGTGTILNLEEEILA